MRAVVLAWMMVVLVAPLAAAQAGPGETANVVFYGHVFSSGLAFPMPSNAQAPEGAEVFGLGSTHACTPVAPPDCDSDPLNKLALFSSAGFVDVKGRDEFTNRGDYTLFHNERGNTKDIKLDPNRNVVASIWMSLDSHVWFVDGGETDCMYPNPPDTGCLYPYWGWDPAVWPDFVVEAKLYAAVLGAHGSSASDPPPIETAIANGEARVIAEGRLEPQQIINGLPGYPNVYEFVIDLGKPIDPVIQRDEDFFLVYNWYTETSGQRFQWFNWRVWAGEYFPPTYTLPVTNAFDVELVIPNFIYDRLVIVGVMNTPWGSYDVDPAGTKLTLREKQSGREITPVYVDTFSDYSVAHGGHYKPVNQTWVWDYKRDNLAPGTYVATVRANNWQNTAYGECTAEFVVLANGRPGPVTIGECGDRTADEAFVDRVARLEGESRTQGGRGIVELPVGVLSAGVVEAGPAPFPALVALAALAAVGVVLRRWRS